MISDVFKHDRYLVRKKLLKLLGGAFHIYGPGGELVLYSRLKAFKLKEDIGLKSILKDEWLFLDTDDREIGSIKEDSMVLALLRRFVISLIPQKYHGEIGGKQVCTFSQNFNPFVTKIAADFSPDTGSLLDRRLGLAAAVLLCAIEGKQD